MLREQYNTIADTMRDRRNYVEGLQTCLGAFQDFEAIRFAWSVTRKAEYVRIQDSINNDVFLHVEGLTKAEIFKEICKVVLAGDLPECVPDRLITDAEQKRELVPLFKEEAK